MVKHFAFICIFVLFFNISNINAVSVIMPITPDYFNDEVYSNYIFNNFDTNHNNILENIEISQIVNIDISDKNVQVINGLEIFTNLREFNCNCKDCEIGTLTFKNMNNLTRINCSDCKIRKLDIINCNTVRYINMSNTLVTELDVSKCNRLKVINCENSELLRKLIIPIGLTYDSINLLNTGVKFVDFTRPNRIGSYIGNDINISFNFDKDLSNNRYYADISNIFTNIQKLDIKLNDDYYLDYKTKKIYFYKDICDIIAYFKTVPASDVKIIIKCSGINIDDEQNNDEISKPDYSNTDDATSNGTSDVSNDNVSSIGTSNSNTENVNSNVTSDFSSDNVDYNGTSNSNTDDVNFNGTSDYSNNNADSNGTSNLNKDNVNNDTSAFNNNNSTILTSDYDNENRNAIMICDSQNNSFENNPTTGFGNACYIIFSMLSVLIILIIKKLS